MLERDTECSLIECAIGDMRAGTSGALLVSGEPGAGKTELLRYAAEHAADVVILRAHGVESESALAFAGLADVLRPVLSMLDQLPPAQARALAAALAIEESAGGVPEAL